MREHEQREQQAEAKGEAGAGSLARGHGGGNVGLDPRTLSHPGTPDDGKV